MEAFVTAIPLHPPPRESFTASRKPPLLPLIPCPAPPRAATILHDKETLPPSPAEWLRANEATIRPRNNAVRISTVATDGIVRAANRKLPGGLLYLAGGGKWLFASPPSYCNVDIGADDLVEMLKKKTFYLGPVTRNKVVRAVELATGAVGISHAQLSENFTVALIVADLQMDCDTVCAAVLRGIVGHPGCTKSDVERHVGTDVLRILTYHSQVEQSVNLCVDSSFTEMSFSNLRELILVGAMEEHRAISLELARGVLAMRTIDKLEDDDEKLTIARRTMYLYAPLANQLGIWFIQGELEELAFMYLQPESFHMVRHLVGERRRECESTLAESKEFLERVLTTTPEVRSLVRTVLIKGRVKGLYSVYRKMRRSGKKVYEIYDLLALRVVVEPKKADEASEKAACYAVQDVIKRHYETFESRAKNYIAAPKRNGYRSLHMTVLPEGGSTPLEIQIRTERMNHVAEFGAAAHWIYKETSAQEEAEAAESATSEDAKEEEKPKDTGDDHDDHDDSGTGAERADRVYKIKTLRSTHYDTLYGTRYGTRSGRRRSRISTLERIADEKPRTMKITMKEAPQCRSAKKEITPIPARVGMARRSDRAEVQEQMRKGYVTCLASAIRTSRVIVAAAGQLYGLAVGSTLLDLAHGLGVASLGAIAVVNGSVAPLTQRLEMNDIVRFISALPEA